ncbi:Kinesin-like protein NACK1 [Platanthera guangdongensis]|uniref:Kinesin-like protein NACK1 n=1 Tax=Platanthera guangdongensis TaxID=2320717 RepID=A0ABR2M5M5_9ASPA
MEKIAVAVRFRPSIAEETSDRQWRIDDNRISLHKPLGTPISGVSFAFDHVFEESSTNSSIYDILIKSIIHAAIEGFNGTAFAYGQTSSGKTFTMNGSQADPGIIPQAVRDIFYTTHMIKNREFLIRVSYMEIYNEEINDLLSLVNQKLPIHESLERGVYVAGLREEIVNNADQVLDLIKLGEEAVDRIQYLGWAHIPYRDSKLTRILQPALGGNAKTSIICTVAPEEVHIEETKGTLQFASRAKRITNCAQVNEILTDTALLKRQKQEIEELRRKLQGHHSEVLEQVILKQRNDMHKSELECEKLAMELEEERKSHQVLKLRIEEQQKRIDCLNELLSSNQASCSIHENFHSDSVSEEMRSKNCMSENNIFATPTFKAMPDHFVMKRPNHSKGHVLSPLPVNFTNIANEDLWEQLNDGFTTNLDALQMTPIGTDLQERTTMERSQVDELKEQYAILERKCGQLRDENSSLAQTLSLSKQDAVLLRAEKEELVRDLNYERLKMKDLKAAIRSFSLAFAERECLLNSLYSTSKAMIENYSSPRFSD